MGCDIHLITEIRKNGKWTYVPERPESFNGRSYALFAFLAQVRGYNPYGFEPRGLPSDISGMKFEFDDETEYLRSRYETVRTDMIKNPDETYREIEKIEEMTSPDKVSVPVKDVYDYDTWARMNEYSYNEETGSYGYWSVDFACVDYHSHSYLGLTELEGKVTEENNDHYDVPKGFIQECDAAGIEWDERFFFEELNDDLVRVTISDEPSYIGLLREGIRELKEIGRKYDVPDEDIRIVFAFDN